MKKTNQQIQKELDEQKYYESIKNGYDMSGKMSYCEKCVSRNRDVCHLDQPARERNSQCAKALDAMDEKLLNENEELILCNAKNLYQHFNGEKSLDYCVRYSLYNSEYFKEIQFYTAFGLDVNQYINYLINKINT